MDDSKLQTITLTEPSDVVAVLNDIFLYTDSRGIVVESNGASFSYLPNVETCGLFFWDVLPLGTNSLESTLNKYPPLHVREVFCDDHNSFLLRIIPLPSVDSSQNGFVIAATDNRPVEALCENYEERLEEKIIAWSDSITLFNAFFDTALDATFLLDEDGLIVAANKAAQNQHINSGQILAGENFKRLLGRRFFATLRNSMHTLDAQGTWTGNIVAIDGDGEGFPVAATLRKIVFSDYSLFQLILHDLTAHVELKEHLQEKQAEVKEKDIALKQVIKSVEQDRQEMREQLTSQVKKQMLPALERLTSSDTAEVREGYKAVIEDQLVDIASDSSGEFDSELLRLSPREMEICQLVQLGRNGKDIAQLLTMSFETVQTHRKNIRKKLGLRGSKVSLFTYLRQKPSLS
nr:LuxR C-terminal-related transcriptional regulator [uncultured Pseudodesulfovibrio sp.]